MALQQSRRFPHAPLLRAGLRVGAPELAVLGVHCDLRQPHVGVLSVCGGSDLCHSSFRFGCGLLAPLLGHEVCILLVPLIHLHSTTHYVFSWCLLMRGPGFLFPS